MLRATRAWGPFLERPETFRAHFGWHNSPCILNTKASRGPKLCRYFRFYSLYNIRKDQLYRIYRSEFYEWLFGPETFSGVSRNSPQVGRNRNLLGPSVEREDFRVVYLSSLSQTFTSTCNGLVVVVRYDSFLQEILNFRYQVKRCAAFLFVEIITMYFKISGLMR